MKTLFYTLALTLMLVVIDGCAIYPLEPSDDRFEIIKEQKGRITEKFEIPDSGESKIELTEIETPLGYPLHYYYALPTFLFPSGISKSGNSLAYIIMFADHDVIRVVRKYSGFQVGDCVKVLFGTSEVRLIYSEGCP